VFSEIQNWANKRHDRADCSLKGGAGVRLSAPDTYAEFLLRSRLPSSMNGGPAAAGAAVSGVQVRQLRPAGPAVRLLGGTASHPGAGSPPRAAPVAHRRTGVAASAGPTTSAGRCRPGVDHDRGS